MKKLQMGIFAIAAMISWMATGTAQAAAMAVRLAGALAERRAEWQALSVEATMTIVAATRSDGCRNTTARRGMTGKMTRSRMHSGPEIGSNGTSG